LLNQQRWVDLRRIDRIDHNHVFNPTRVVDKIHAPFYGQQLEARFLLREKEVSHIFSPPVFDQGVLSTYSSPNEISERNNGLFNLFASFAVARRTAAQLNIGIRQSAINR